MEEYKNNSENAKKITRWESTMSKLDSYGSNEGDDVPIDQNIKECIAALNMLNIPTTASCGGHTDKDKLISPVVQGILENDFEGNRSSLKLVQSLLEEFNKDRTTSFKLLFNPHVTNGFRIESVVDNYDENMIIEKEDEYDKEKIKSLVLGAQKEFEDFTDFLKKKYFE